MNQNAFMINGAGIDPFLLDPNADLNKIFFDKTGTTPGDVDFDWTAYTVTPLGLDFNTSAEYPFPAPETNAAQPFSTYPLTQETLAGYSEIPAFGGSVFPEQIMDPAGYPTDMTMAEDYSTQQSSYNALAQQQITVAPQTVVAPAKVEITATKTRSGGAQKKNSAAPIAANGDDAPPPVRRRGARKKIRTEEELRLKRENHLKRNRDAAQKCRARKKDSEDKRREEVLALSTRNQELWGYFESLRLEFQTLRETEFPKVEAWETEKMAACKRALEMEGDLTAKMRTMREDHDLKKLSRHHRQEDSATMSRSNSQMSHGSYGDGRNSQSPQDVQPTSPTSLSHNVQQQSRPMSSASNQATYLQAVTTQSPNSFHSQDMQSSINNLHLNTALSRRVSVSSSGHTRIGYDGSVHRPSHDSGYSNGDSPQSKKFFGSPDTDEAIGDSRESPVQKTFPPSEMINPRLPYFIPPTMTKGPNVGVDPAEFMAANSFLFGNE